MNAPARNSISVYWLVPFAGVITLAAAILLLWFTRARINDRPPALGRVALICTKLHSFAVNNPTGFQAKASTTNLDDLVAIGALSEADVAYIRDRQIQFYGFDPKRVGPEIPVLGTPITWRKKPYLLVGYSDGHAAAHKLEGTP